VTIKFGVLLDHQFPPGDDLSAHLRSLIHVTETAEALGYDAVFGIHHFLAGLQTPQPFQLLARLIPHSGNMLLGTAIYVATLTHPVQIAEEVATLDQLSEGRFVFGVGAGYRPEEFGSFGIEHASRGRRLVEALEVIRGLWQEGGYSHDGEFFQIDNQRSSVRPAQPTGPPIWIGANVERTVRRAAHIGDAWLASPNVKQRWAAGHLDMFREEQLAAGRSLDGPAPIAREIYLADDDETARAEVDPYLRAEYHEYAAYDLEYFDTMYDDLMGKAFLVGSPTTVARRIQELIDVGFDFFLFRVFWSGMPYDMSIRTLERFTAEVLPRLTERMPLP